MASETTEPPSEEVLLFRDPGEDDDERERERTDPDVRVRPLRILSVTGAKGGVGKSMLASNLAVYLASIGRRVVLADASIGGANLHTMLGIARPKRGEPTEDGPAPNLIETPVPGLRLHHAGLDEAAIGEPRRTRRTELEAKLRALDADYVVVDLGAGTSRTLIDFHLAADLSVFVTLPEPTAIENTYRFLRYAFVRFLRRSVEGAAREELMEKTREMGGAPAPLDLWRRLEDDGDPLADAVRHWMERFRPSLVLNQTRLRADLELGEALRTAARRRLGVYVDYLGHIDYDDAVWSCVRNRRLLLVESPGSKSAKTIEKIARRLVVQKAGAARRGTERTVPPESHHDLLEVERGATDEEVRRAFKRAREIYAADALACYGLFEPEEIEKVRTRVEEAFDVLLDPARRRPYELSVFPITAEEDEDEPHAIRRTADLPPPPVITPDTDFTGPLLRHVRESQGVDLRAVSHTTKVGLAYLRAIEEDEYALLPAPVYVRGFVTELAKFLHLDAAHVSRTYVKRYKRYLEEREVP